MSRLRLGRKPLTVVVSTGAPAPARPMRVHVDLRSAEQRAADQERVNRLGFPRGAWRP